MTPPELEFRPLDIERALPLLPPQVFINYDRVSETLNRILAEKLAKCPKVYYPSLDDDWFEGPVTEGYYIKKSAYLVNIKSFDAIVFDGEVASVNEIGETSAPAAGDPV